MSSVSGAQHRAMEAAKSGHSTLGIPKSVGAEYSAADKGIGKKHLPEHVGMKHLLARRKLMRATSAPDRK